MSQSRRAFLVGYSAIREAIAEQAVLKPGNVGALLRRGLAVSTFNILENFVEQRIFELVERINSGHLGFRDLPEKLKEQSTRNVLKVAGTRATRMELDALIDLSKSIGGSLSSLDGQVTFSPLAWGWVGSNMGHEDLNSALRTFHVKDSYGSMRTLSGTLGFQTKDQFNKDIDLRQQLKDLASERHSSAHDSKHDVSAMVIGANVAVALKLAICFDSLASRASVALRSGSRDYLDDIHWTSPNRISIRTVQQREKDFAELKPGQARAVAVGKAKDEVLTAAMRRCGDSDLLVVKDRTGAIVDWRYPSCD